MSIASAQFKGKSIKRRILLSKTDLLFALDFLQPQDSYSPASDEGNALVPYVKIGEIKNWWSEELRGDKGIIYHEFYIQADATITANVLSRCHLLFNNQILRVESRSSPFGDQQIAHILTGYFSGEVYVDHPGASYPQFKSSV